MMLIFIALSGATSAALRDRQTSGRLSRFFQDQTDNVEMNKYLDIRYYQSPGYDPDLTSYDIYTSPDAVKQPVIVYIHGGGWSKGDKSSVGYKPGYFTQNGFVFVSINYRLVPGIEFPENINDVARALVSIHKTIDQYGGDPGRIFVMGHSAGSHLAALIATDNSRLKEYGLDLSIIKGVIPIDFTIYNLEKRLAVKTPGMSILYKAFGEDPKVWRDASPMLHVEKGKNIPPFLLIYAGRNEARKTESNEMKSVLIENGIHAEVAGFPKKNHATVNRSIGDPDDETTKEIITFLNAILEDLE